MIRIAAVGDLHFGDDSAGTLAPLLHDLPDTADMLLVVGDHTRHGAACEAEVLARELADVGVPVVAVLGNHDYHQEEEADVIAVLRQHGVHVLDGESMVLEIDDVRVGIAGMKGFGGGFAGACGSVFGEREMKAFAQHTHDLADHLHTLLDDLDADVRIVMLHYSPVEETLRGERLEIYPFLGSYLLGEAIDTAGADIVFHGHAHHGVEKGITPGGIHVRNVAQPVIRQPYRLYSIEPRSTVALDGAPQLAAQATGSA